VDRDAPLVAGITLALASRVEPLALGPAWSPRDLVWPAVLGYLGDARWASIYAAAAGATLLWTSTWWAPAHPGRAASTPESCPTAPWPASP
jgi:hypothetical protein